MAEITFLPTRSTSSRTSNPESQLAMDDQREPVTRCSDLQSRYDALLSENKRIKQSHVEQISKMQEEIASLSAENVVQRDSECASQQELDLGDEQGMQEKVDALTDKNDELFEMVAGLRARNESLEEKAAEYQQCIDTLSTKLDQLEKDKVTWRERERELRRAALEAHSQVEQLLAFQSANRLAAELENLCAHRFEQAT